MTDKKETKKTTDKKETQKTTDKKETKKTTDKKETKKTTDKKNEDTQNIATASITKMFDEIVNIEASRVRSGRPSTDRNRQEIIINLKEHDNFILRSLLMANFSSKIKFPFPSGMPPFKPNTKSVIVSKEQIQTMGKMISSFSSLLHKKEQLFINLLESINIADAQLLCLIKDKKLTDDYPAITEDIIKEVWPNLL